MSKKQLLSRLLQIVVVLVGISFITFFLTYLSPGDPVENMYISMGQMPSEEIVAQTREEMGLNDPFLTQYVRWLGNCLHGDFGTSYSLRQPVTELLLERIGPTLRLAAMALGMMLLLSVPLGVFRRCTKIPGWIIWQEGLLSQAAPCRISGWRFC